MQVNYRSRLGVHEPWRWLVEKQGTGMAVSPNEGWFPHRQPTRSISVIPPGLAATADCKLRQTRNQGPPSIHAGWLCDVISVRGGGCWGTVVDTAKLGGLFGRHVPIAAV